MAKFIRSVIKFWLHTSTLTQGYQVFQVSQRMGVYLYLQNSSPPPPIMDNTRISGRGVGAVNEQPFKSTFSLSMPQCRNPSKVFRHRSFVFIFSEWLSQSHSRRTTYYSLFWGLRELHFKLMYRLVVILRNEAFAPQKCLLKRFVSLLLESKKNTNKI